MNYKETLDYINSVRLNQWKLGLSRTRELLDMLGNPQDDLRFVHVGGTNGKGSTCAMIESVLRCSGFRTGSFPSPYIEDFRERICVSGEMISKDDLCRITEKVKSCADRMEDEPSHFEIVTAIGMMYFKEKCCDIVVLEVGLGGEFDATNIIAPPLLSILTNIGFDHTEYLGTTLGEIARTKGGIIKTPSPVVVYPNTNEVIDTLKDICRERGCEMSIADFDRLKPGRADLFGQSFTWQGSVFGGGSDIEISMPLIGEYQLRNAALALTALEKLKECGIDISKEALTEGMAKVSWPARFEVLGHRPIFILDGGHNPQCAEAVAESLRKYFPGGGITFVIGVLADKDYNSVLDTLLPFAKKCYCVAPASERALKADDLAACVREKGIQVETFETTELAIRKALEGSEPVLAFGSLYMAGEVRTAYRKLRS